MLLLYQNGKLSVLAEMKLYIPLCFYYITSAVIPFSYNLSLHSTMLLLYLEEHTVITITTSFTFHYASTISGVFRACFWCSFTLHSTMLLLYRTLFCATHALYASLHSTMLLLYRNVLSGYTFTSATFTFHYASTISRYGSS